MQLAAYLADREISMSAFARAVGAKNARTIQRYVKHGRLPSRVMMDRITAETEGAVQPNDFYAVAGE